MVRQCAWCLRLINGAGERVSPSPLPKLYEASHGICEVCGMSWIAQATEAERTQGPVNRNEDECGGIGSYPAVERGDKQTSITEFVLNLQQQSTRTVPEPLPKRHSRLRIL